MILPDWLQAGNRQSGVPGDGLRYWFRTSMGLEDLVTEELRQHLPVREAFRSHRNVLVQLSPEAGPDIERQIEQLRTPDDVYRYLGCCSGIDRTKPAVAKLISFLREQVLPMLSAQAKSRYLRLTLSFVGKRNYSRFFVENQFNEVVAAQTTLIPLSNEQKTGKQAGELRLRVHIEEDIAFIGLGLQDTPLHRRPWRSILYDGQLHTPVAAAMARSLSPKTGSLVIDPFCGSGTILIESAIQFAHCRHLGYDIAPAALEAARKSAALAGVDVRFLLADSLQAAPPEEPYYLISNPPWDEKHLIEEKHSSKFVQQLASWVSHSSGAVLLLPEELAETVRLAAGLPMGKLAQTRVRGKLALIINHKTILRVGA